jgi:hypothetical protein
MENITINIPEGYEIDMEKSDLSKGIVQFKQIKEVLTYRDVSTALFGSKMAYWISLHGGIVKEEHGFLSNLVEDKNNSSTKEQLESILALNKLCNVAKYLNGDWLPYNRNNACWCLLLVYSRFDAKKVTIEVIISKDTFSQHSIVYFKNKELAQQAINILGEGEIRKALTLNH